jgi:hypothetical protein
MYSSRHVLRSIHADDPPPLIVEGLEFSRNARQLLRDAPVVHTPAAVNAAAKPCGVEHNRLDHLEDLAFEHMRRDLGIAAAFKLRAVVHVFLGLATTAVRGLMI